MMWAILGDIEFEVIGSPDGWEQRFSGDFAEHARISGKPRLEALGGQLDEMTWNIRLHERLHDVQARLREIRLATAQQTPLALVMGDGAWLGPWVIVEGTVTTSKTTPGGRLVSAELSITLREFTGEFTGEATALESATRLGLQSATVQPGLMTQAAQKPTDAQSLVNAARQAENVVRSTESMLTRAQSLPAAAAIAQVPGMLGALAPAAQAATTLQQLGSRVQEAQAMTQLGSNLAFHLQSIRTGLSAPQPATIGQQLIDAGSAARLALQQFDNARATLLQLIADVAMRRR